MGAPRRPGAARAAFLAGAADLNSLPPEGRPEVAVAGRSNVGKSSLFNRVVGHRGLARVSKTPGRTQQINFFDVDQRVVLADLPGYGFARVPLAEKARWRVLVEGYLTRRRVLRGVLVLVDVRRGLEPEDAQLLDFLAAHALPARVVATKIDKIGRGARLAALARLAASAPAPIGFSSVTGEGTDAVWDAINVWVAPR
ncbi:MAG: ribosome biogenesis GTP-binding protein YihA/YsxC [Candidatus Binatia bacterium]